MELGISWIRFDPSSPTLDKVSRNRSTSSKIKAVSDSERGSSMKASSSRSAASFSESDLASAAAASGVRRAMEKWKLEDSRVKKLWSRREIPTSIISLFSTTLSSSPWIPTAESFGTAELRSPATKSRLSDTLPKFSTNSLLLLTTLLIFILKSCSPQLARSIADDVDLMTWLHHRIWPYESSMTEEDSYISTLLCGIELIHSGVTCFAEAGGQHVSGMAKAVELLGLRACLTQSIMDCGEGLPAPWAAITTDDCIQSQKELYKKHHNTADGRIRVWFGIRQIMNATERLLIETRDNAVELETGIHMHVAEIPYENLKVMNERKVDHGTVTYLEEIQFLRNNLLSAHTVWVNDNEISFLSRNGVKISHCPASAMRMLGFAPIREMLDAGICVSIGTDGAPSNNRMSIVDEMYLASLINKGREVYANGTTNPSVLPAEVVLQMVTINGAKSVLWENEIGLLEVGKKADMVVINPSSWSMVPSHDSISCLVYSMRTENVISVMCNGQWIMKDKKIINVNEEDVILMAKQASKKLLERAGIRIPNRMNFI